MRRLLLPAVAVFAAPVPAAEAVGFITQLSCASDYYAYCSKHEVGSPGLRKCMNDNGPRLSSSCINALISDGEISKEEVARRRDQYLASKAPPKPGQTADVKVADKSAAASKQVAARLAEVGKPLPTDVVMTSALVLDQKTYLALKNRGDRFVIETGAPSSEASPDAIANSADVPAGDAPAIAATVPPVAAAEALAQTTPAPAEALPGKMALGKKPAVETPPEVEEVVAPRKPSSAEIWLNYMQNRFDGGMNYEGIDANF